MTTTDIWMISLTGLIAIAGVISATIFNNQFSVMQRQLDEMQRAYGPLKESADAAKQSADVAKQALISVQRAFVYPIEFRFFRFKNTALNTDAWAYHPFLKNSGSTPAHAVETRSAMIVLNEEMKDDFVLIEPFRADPTYYGPQEAKGGPPAGIPIADAVAAWQGTKFVYAWGSVEYDDAFPGTPRHRVEYCFQVGIAGDPRQNNTPVVQITYTRHNRLYEIDRDKPRQEYKGKIPDAWAKESPTAKYSLPPPPFSN